MNIELEITDEQLDILLDQNKDNEAMQSIYWQLKGYWLAGGDGPGNGFLSRN